MKTLLNRKLTTTICKFIVAGATYEVAALAAGIDRRTLFAWRQRGKRELSGIYRELVNALEKADADFVNIQLANIQRHSKLTWQASAWLLERRHPEQFGRSDRYHAAQLRELQSELAAIRVEMAKPQFRIAE